MGLELKKLSAEERAAYEQQRAEYHTLRGKKQAEIATEEQKIATARGDIRNLESEINAARPVLPNANTSIGVCKKCDIYSMQYSGFTPGQGERRRWYECLLCGYEDSHT